MEDVFVCEGLPLADTACWLILQDSTGDVSSVVFDVCLSSPLIHQISVNSISSKADYLVVMGKIFRALTSFYPTFVP